MRGEGMSPPAPVLLSWRRARPERVRRPPHPLGPRVVRVLRDLPDATGRHARRPARAARVRPLLRLVPARRPDGGRRRLPGGPPGGRRADPRARRRRAASPSAPGTSSWTSSWSRARRSSATCRWGWPGRPTSAGPWTSATCPTCSATSPRCPSCCALGRVRPRRGVAGGPVGDRPHRRSGGRRPTARGSGPST